MGCGGGIPRGEAVVVDGIKWGWMESVMHARASQSYILKSTTLLYIQREGGRDFDDQYYHIWFLLC